MSTLCKCSAFTLVKKGKKTRQHVLTVGPGEQESHNSSWCGVFQRDPYHVDSRGHSFKFSRLDR